MKQAKHILLTAALLLCSLAASAKVEIEGIWYNLDSSTKQAEVTSGGDYTGSITIPSMVTYEGVNYSVTAIELAAFFRCTSLTAITIPESVTSIGDYAFFGCKKILDVYCYAKNLPTTEKNTFEGSYIQHATLYVQEDVLNSYKSSQNG